MDAIISGRAWISLTDVKDLNKLKKQLTIVPKDLGYGVRNYIYLYEIKNGYIGVPRSYFLRNAMGRYNIIDKTVRPPCSKIDFLGTLKLEQSKLIASVLPKFNNDNFYGGIICSPCGTGKTVMALNILSQLGLKALVVVHKEFLMNQWKIRIKEFLPKAKVGYVQQDVCDFEDKDIVIGMMQSLSQKTYSKELYHNFGLVILDEVHRSSAPTWASVAPKFNAKYFLGVSATPTRKDGTDGVFLNTIGDIIYTAKDEKVAPSVRIYFYEDKNFRAPLTSRERYVTMLGNNMRRNMFIATKIAKAVESGRKILVLSERLNQLGSIGSILISFGITPDYYVGGRKQKDLDTAADNQVILGTYQMAREALDIAALDTLFLATPVSDVVQAVGRIQRVHENKKEPLVVDFFDTDVLTRGSFNKRHWYYNSKGWKIEKIKSV